MLNVGCWMLDAGCWMCPSVACADDSGDGDGDGDLWCDHEMR